MMNIEIASNWETNRKKFALQKKQKKKNYFIETVKSNFLAKIGRKISWCTLQTVFLFQKCIKIWNQEASIVAAMMY